MSRNEKRIRDAIAAVGGTCKSVTWEPVGRGAEMCGPSGGWLVDGFEPIGYSTEQALAYIAEFPHRFARDEDDSELAMEEDE